jgi:flavin reductase (DIM6/NTAB) family NADH-FMN oxidoreductase RutF
VTTVADQFKHAMRRMPAGVALITSRDAQGQPHGMAASSVISVSMEPPALLVAINRTAGLHPVLHESMELCVNLLTHSQRHLLEAFSRSEQRAQRFAGQDWRDVGSGLPWLASASAAVCCRVDKTMDYSTHTIFIACVLELRATQPSPEDDAPVVWFDGRCMSLATAPAPCDAMS